jgi:periplasmic protein CpxP/Spy
MTRRMRPYLAALLAASSLAFALPAAQAHRGDGAHAPHGPMRALRGLDLTDAQREQARAIFKEQAGALRERMQAARSAQQELRALAFSPSFDSGRARDFADTAAKAQADIALMRAESMSKVVALLTPEQRAKLEERRERRGRR